MEIATRSSRADESLVSAVSWASILAGAIAACAVTLILMAVGAGIGLSSISPWSGEGVSATTFSVGTGIFLIIVAVMSSAVGGYLAARLRTAWVGLHTNEVFFRDTAHGFIAWALATLLLASVLSSAATTIVGGAAAGLGMGASQAAGQASGPADVYVDKLLRPADTSAGAAATAPATGNTANAGSTTNAGNTANGNASDSRGELTRIFLPSLKGSEISAADRTYVARVVASRTGMSQADAERRVNDVITEAKQATDAARKAAAKLALWLAASLLFGAFAAALAAVEGGQLRDGTWDGRKLTPREI